jgi:hypothetical protein
MKSLMFILKVVIIPAILYPSTLSAQIPNQGFEDWTDMGNYNNPDQWSTLNDMTAPSNGFTCTKGSPGNPGSSYIKLTSRNISGMGLKPGIAVSGGLDTSYLQAVSGFSLTGRPESLSGNWQYMAFGNDQGYISILLTKWNADQQIRDTVSYTYHPLAGMEMSWAEFTIALDYQSSLFPDSCIVFLSSSNANGAPTAINSFLYIDNLNFNNIITSINDQKIESGFQLYPNPAKSEIFIELPTTYKTVIIRIFDMKGQILLRKENQNISDKAILDVHNLPYGTFLIQVQSEKGVQSALFIRN